MLKKIFNNELKFEKAVLIVISAFVFLMLYYYDNQTAFLRIQDNMHRIFVEGKWYYAFNGWSAIPYGILLQVICGIWSLPIFILSEFSVISAESIVARLWYKLFIIIFLILDMQQIGKLSEKIGVEKTKTEWVKLFFISSLLVMLPAVHIAQFDAVSLFFILLGINAYYDNKHFTFLVSFMFAIAGKYMPLFIFIPLVLLKEKKYLYILRDLIAGCALIVADKAMNSIGYRIETYLGIDPLSEILTNPTMQSDFELLLHSNIRAFDSQMSIVLLGFILLCIWCYVKKTEESNSYAIHASFAGFSLLFAFGCSTPYWIILVVPFFILIIFSNEQHFNILFPLELIFSIGFVYIYTIKFPWIFGAENTFSFLLYSLIPGYLDQIHGTIKDFIALRALDGFDGAMSAAMVACLLVTFILTMPLNKRSESSKGDGKMNSAYIKGWYWARITVLVGWLLLNVWVVMLNHVN